MLSFSRNLRTRSWLILMGPLLLPCVSVSSAEFFVSTKGDDVWAGSEKRPFATLKRALGAAVRNDTITVRGGVYQLDAPIEFGPDDSDMTIRNYPGERPVFSGGRRLIGWKKGDDGVWFVDIPEVRDGAWYFNQLFVNGERRRRARIPNEGYLRSEGPTASYPRDRAKTRNMPGIRDSIKFAAGDLKADWRNLDDVNVFVYHSWTSSLHWIKEIDEDAGVVRFTNPSGWPMGWWEKKQRYFVENVREELDASGEWYLDRKTGRLEYLPLPGEDINSVEAVAPVLNQLVTIDGDWQAGETVHDVTLKGLSFQHTDWVIEDKTKNADGQAAAFLGAAFHVNGAERIVIEDCEIAHVGEYGLLLEAGCKDNRIVRCEIHDLAAGGVRVGETMRQKTASKDSSVKGVAIPELTFEGTGARDTSRNVIDNCFIHDGGNVFPAGIGVFVGHSAHNAVTHNEICDFRYSGVSVGWVWGFGKSAAHHNIFADNHIHHLGWGELSDMGGIYSLGPSPGTIERHNYIHHINSYAYGGWGLYTDEGSSDILLENNVVHDTKTGGFHQHYGRDNIIRNNIFAFSREAQIQRSREDLTNSVVFERNLVYCDNDKALIRVWDNGDYHLDNNVYWTTAKSDLIFDGRDWDEWRETSGQDANSLLADPMFVDAEKRDFRLKPGSPAEEVAFVPIEMTGFGLYGDKEWVSKPLEVKRPPFNLPATAEPANSGIDDDFETTPVGDGPVGAKVSGEEGGASIRVTDELAASGKRSLKFVDAEGLDKSYAPHMFYQPNMRKGVVRESFDVRMGEGAMLNHEWRDTKSPYNTGPALNVNGKGELSAGRDMVMTIPHGVWVHIEIVAEVGKSSTKTWDLAVTIEGDETRRFETIAFRKNELDRLQWVGFVSNATTATTFYVDNISLENE